MEYRFHDGPRTPVDTVLGSSIQLEQHSLLVSGDAAQVVRAPHRPGGYRVTVATGRSYTPWVRRVEVE